MKTIEKIRQKIEELYDGEAPAHDQQCDFDDGYFTGIGAISKFLDTLQEPEKSQDTVGRVSVEIRSNLKTDEVVRKTLIMLVNDGRISVTGAITSSDILDWLEGQKEPEVDLEKKALNFGEEIGVPVSDKFMQIARHFYELGKNSK